MIVLNVDFKLFILWCFKTIKTFGYLVVLKPYASNSPKLYSSKVEFIVKKVLGSKDLENGMTINWMYVSWQTSFILSQFIISRWMKVANWWSCCLWAGLRHSQVHLVWFLQAITKFESNQTEEKWVVLVRLNQINNLKYLFKKELNMFLFL